MADNHQSTNGFGQTGSAQNGHTTVIDNGQTASVENGQIVAAENGPTASTEKVDFSAPLDLSCLTDLNVLVTGGANGLGAHITSRLAEYGARVTIADLNLENGEKVSKDLNDKGFRTTFVKTDVTDWNSQVNAFKAAYSMHPTCGIDIVIPCAGLAGFPLQLSKSVSLDKDPEPPANDTFDVVLKGVYYTTLLSLHYFRLPSPVIPGRMRRQLLFIGSLASYLEIPPMADYSASKFGVRGLWKTIREEIRQMGYRTNLIAPTFMPTQVILPVADALEERGAKLASVGQAVDAVMRLLADERAEGRAVAVGGYGNFDIRDDSDGLDGGIETLKYFASGGMGPGMQGLKDVLGGRT
ncbi:NAD(P)-binding protein [Viridothelium virens]|uniref:NAD(P)-binding protein n=1 Tax=Viridothelium virens TaxID=1048519 RepID=A0A6A6HI21_VIRVR|nr:NAD(P)-binding protein [Viridothelium virens]